MLRRVLLVPPVRSRLREAIAVRRALGPIEVSELPEMADLSPDVRHYRR